ncbi:MAG: FAD-binding dehydrogenase, partial [Acidobacteria bacterium]
GLSIVPPRSALWLNSRGERIGPEPMITGFDTRRLVTQVCAQEKQFSWQVLNWKIAVKELAVSGSEFNEAIRDKKIFAFLKNVLLGNRGLVEDLTENCVDFVVAESIDQLGDRMNELCGNDDVDRGILRSTIEGYDSNIGRGPKFFNDDQLRRLTQLRRYKGDKARTCNFQRIDDPKALPLIAIREFILSRKSLGGLQTDVRSRVLDRTGEPLEGLYAVGEAAGFGGGGSHGLRALEGTFLGCCVLTARKAAEDILG